MGPIDNSLGMVDQVAARRRELDAAAVTVKDLGAEIGLQIPDLGVWG